MAETLGTTLHREVTRSAQAWLQYDVTFAPGGRTESYRRLAALARELLGAELAEDFFFMHKPPGLRLRFRVEERRERVDTIVRRALHERRTTCPRCGGARRQ